MSQTLSATESIFFSSALAPRPQIHVVSATEANKAEQGCAGLGRCPRAAARGQTDACKGDDHGVAGVFDYYVFQQEWQASYCVKDSGAQGCLMPTTYMQNNFTVHGLWPQYHNETDGHWWPQCCPSVFGADLAQSTVDALWSPLHWYWPDVNAQPWPNYNKSSFWDHEWQKHGTCSGLNQVDYMHAAMAVEDSFPVPRDIIANAGKSLDRSVIDKYYNKGRPCTPKKDCPVALGCSGGKFLLSVSSCWSKGSIKQIPCDDGWVSPVVEATEKALPNKAQQIFQKTLVKLDHTVPIHAKYFEAPPDEELLLNRTGALSQSWPLGFCFSRTSPPALNGSWFFNSCRRTALQAKMRGAQPHDATQGSISCRQKRSLQWFTVPERRLILGLGTVLVAPD
eukprot:g16973.t1